MSDPTGPRAKLTNDQLAAAFKEIGVSVTPATIDGWAAAGVPTDPHAKLARKRVAAALPAARLTNYIFAHSKYSSILGQSNVLSGLLADADEQEPAAKVRAVDGAAVSHTAVSHAAMEQPAPDAHIAP